MEVEKSSDITIVLYLRNFVIAKKLQFVQFLKKINSRYDLATSRSRGHHSYFTDG